MSEDNQIHITQKQLGLCWDYIQTRADIDGETRRKLGLLLTDLNSALEPLEIDWSK